MGKNKTSSFKLTTLLGQFDHINREIISPLHSSNVQYGDSPCKLLFSLQFLILLIRRFCLLSMPVRHKNKSYNSLCKEKTHAQS